MGLLSSIFSSQAAIDAAFGMLKKHMKENGSKYFILGLKDDDTFDFQQYPADLEPQIFSKAQVEAIQRVMQAEIDTAVEVRARLTDLQALFDRQEQAMVQLTAICEEQEKTILELRQLGDGNDETVTRLNEIIKEQQVIIQELRSGHDRMPEPELTTISELQKDPHDYDEQPTDQ